MNAPAPERMDELLARRVRPGVVDVAHLRRLAGRYRDAFQASPLLARLLARRGEQDLAIAHGALVLAQPPLPLADEAPLPVVGASESRVLPVVAALPTPADRAPLPISQPPAAKSAATTDLALRAASSPSAPAMAAPPHVVLVLRTVEKSPGLPAQADSEIPPPPKLARALPVMPPLLVPGESVLARLPVDRESALQAAEADTITTRVMSPLDVVAVTRAAQARELPGPTIAADLLLPPNPQPTPRLQMAARVAVDGQMVESSPLPLAFAQTPPPAPAAEHAAPLAERSPSPTARAMPAANPAAIPAPPPLPRAPAKADPQQLADEVARELTRSLRRARERKGMSPWTS